jgi:hypothetical protein
MKGWLQKILIPPVRTGQGRSLPVQNQPGHVPAQLRGAQPVAPTPLPNATVIYGIGASLLFVATFFLLVAGRWFPAFVVFSLGACLVGFALHLLKHQD